MPSHIRGFGSAAESRNGSTASLGRLLTFLWSSVWPSLSRMQSESGFLRGARRPTAISGETGTGNNEELP